MTSLDPTIATVDRPDQLGGALQQGLPRPMHPKLTWNVIRTVLLGGISGGIIPLVFLARRFHDFAKAEQMQFWHLAEWLRLQTGDAEATAATEAAKRVMPSLAWRFASLAFVVVAIAIASSAVRRDRDGQVVAHWFDLTLPEFRPALHEQEARMHMEESRLDESQSGRERDDDWRKRSDTYFYTPRGGIQRDWRRFYDADASNDAVNGETITSPRLDLIHAFALAISGAALCWLIEINTHIGRVRRFVFSFNQLSGRYGIGPVREPGVQLGLRPLWILGAAATCALGGFWAVPVMLAAAAQRRYIKTVSQRLRMDLARRQRDVLLTRRPSLRVPASTHLLGACPRENCRAPHPPEAVYCRRCGMRLA